MTMLPIITALLMLIAAILPKPGFTTEAYKGEIGLHVCKEAEKPLAKWLSENVVDELNSSIASYASPSEALQETLKSHLKALSNCARNTYLFELGERGKAYYQRWYRIHDQLVISSLALDKAAEEKNNEELVWLLELANKHIESALQIISNESAL